MALLEFITGLLNEGAANVFYEINSISEEDRELTITTLREFYEIRKSNLPLTPPEFSEEAAFWGATFLYRSVQLLLLREIDEEKIPLLLKDYEGVKNPSSIISADLTLQYLPDFLSLATAMAPADKLVEYLKKTAQDWPFSSVGISIPEDSNHDAILTHPSLRLAYADRIIKYKDINRAKNKLLQPFIIAALGGYAMELWPESIVDNATE